MNLQEYERLLPRCTVKSGAERVTYFTPTMATKWRVDTLFSKEPVTIDWLASFERHAVLADIGANVGMYAIWAAKTRAARVYAFEPESQNYAILNRNIYLNRLGGQVTAFCLALSDAAGMSALHLSKFEAGGSCHSLGEQVDFAHRPMQPAYSQGSVAARLDDLVASGAMPAPQHIKIDVDGFEPKVIAGARQTLRGDAVRSLLIEVNRNLDDHRAMVAELSELGFRFDPAQVTRAERQSGAFKGVAEHVFVR